MPDGVRTTAVRAVTVTVRSVLDSSHPAEGVTGATQLRLRGAAVTHAPSDSGAAARAMILPVALAQFIASYAATNMNVAISAIAEDLGTTVSGVQTRSRCSP